MPDSKQISFLDKAPDTICSIAWCWPPLRPLLVLQVGAGCAGAASNVIIKSFDKLAEESCSGSKSQRAAMMGWKMGRSSLTSFLVWIGAQIQTQTPSHQIKLNLQN